MRKSARGLLVGFLVLALGPMAAGAQETVAASDAENDGMWFVELLGKPTADGNSLASVRNEKAAFRKAAAAAGVGLHELRAYDSLFNGFSVKADLRGRNALALLPGVKAIWPVEVIHLPQYDFGVAQPQLDRAIQMSRANQVHSDLGYTGAGVRVAVMDTGIDYDHGDFGGDGVARSNSAVFPTARVVAGWDFVGDSFTAGLTPVADPFPDDCNGHGSHVAGIVGANGGLTGVAPDVTFGAYRVFGCDGSTTADIMLAAMEVALADKMDVLNMSIGSRAQWPQYPTAAAATRLQQKGMVVVASIGNNGPGGSQPDGPYAAGAPGVGQDVIGVASFDNAQVSFAVNDTPYGYNSAVAAPLPPTSGSLPLARTPSTTLPPAPQTNPPTPGGVEGCPAAADYPGSTWQGGATFAAGSFNGQAVLIRRGTCGFHAKAWNAQQAGAAAVVLYNNTAGGISPTVAGAPAITIPVVAITQAQGATLDGLIAVGPTTLNWTDQAVTFPFGTGGLISAFSSFGMAADLSLKPDIGGPGGGILSTIPLEIGGYGINSGTSMSSPHVAGSVALLLQANRNMRPSDVRARLQNSAKPQPWSGSPALGFLDYAHRQGAGMVDIYDAILATADVTPGKLSLGESEAGPQTRRLTIRNRGASPVTFDLSNVQALATGPKSQTSYPTVSTFLAPATVSFSADSLTVPGQATRTVDVTVTPPAAPALGQYGGYIVLTAQGDGATYRVPYAGFIGDYQALPVLRPTVTPAPHSFPWLAKLNEAGTTFTNQPGGAGYTMLGNDTPFFLVHFDHHVQRYEFRVTNATTGQPLHPVFSNFDQADFVPRNASATGFFAFSWDGTRIHSNGKSNLRKFVPNGSYIVELRALKALGNPGNPDHWETWASPVVTIARP